jgi:hypothetical protein
MQYVRLDIVRYVTKADALTLGAAYSRPKVGRVPSPLEHASALLTTGPVLLPSSGRGPLLCPVPMP